MGARSGDVGADEALRCRASPRLNEHKHGGNNHDPDHGLHEQRLGVRAEDGFATHFLAPLRLSFRLGFRRFAGGFGLSLSTDAASFGS
ncbi:hypothetical protein P7L87_26400, partial [Vibrio parahaemolyticus]|nr:hypothetical protein [Vibrio parahaemolyticus]